MISAAQLVAEVTIEGASQAQITLRILSDSADSAQQNLRKIKGSSEEAGSSLGGGFLGGIRSAFSGMLNFGSQLGQTIFGIQSLAQGAVSLAQNLLGPAVSAETVTTALTTLDGSAKKAAKEMADLDAFAAKTPFKTLDIDQAAEQLQGFGESAGNVIPEITAIGDALGSVGKETPAELDSVVQIFGKMRTEGKVTAMTMNELAVHGINGWQALAAATGKNIPELKNMVANGLLPANDAIKYLTQGIEMNPLYKGGMAKAAGTFTGLLSTLQSNWDQLMSSFGTPIIKALEGSLNNLGSALASPAFKSFAGSIGQGIVEVFQDIGGGVQTVARYFANFDLTSVTFAFKNLGGVVENVVSPFEKLGSNKAVSVFFTNLRNDLSQGIVAAIKDVSGFINNLASALSGLASNSSVKGFLGSIASGFQQVSGIVGGQLKADFKEFTDISKDLGKWWQTTMAPAIASVMPSFTKLASIIATTVVPAFAKIWAVGQQVTRDVMPYLIKAFETIAPIVVKVGGFIANNLGKAIQFLTPYIVQAAQSIGQFASEIADRVAPIIQNLWTMIMSGVNAFLPLWKAVWPTVSAILKATWDVITGIVKVAWALVSGIIKIGLDLLSGNWKKAWEDIKNMFSGIWDGIKTILKGVWDGIWSIIKSGINFVISLINDFIGGIDSIGIDIGSVHVHPNIPKIPLLAAGTDYFQGGPAILGEGNEPEVVTGPHLAMLPRGSSVTPLSHLPIGGQTQIIVQPPPIYLDGRLLTNGLMPHVANAIRYQAGAHGL